MKNRKHDIIEDPDDNNIEYITLVTAPSDVKVTMDNYKQISEYLNNIYKVYKSVNRRKKIKR